MLTDRGWERWAIAGLGLGCTGVVAYVVRRAVVADGPGSGRWQAMVGVRAVWLGLIVSVLWGLAVAVSVSSQAQESAVRQTPAAVARARANDEMDDLRNEIRLLIELRDAQEALRDLNRLRVEAGELETVLNVELCGRLRTWCLALPGTFGERAAGGKQR